jgi:hypothetical protein
MSLIITVTLSFNFSFRRYLTNKYLTVVGSLVLKSVLSGHPGDQKSLDVYDRLF